MTVRAFILFVLLAFFLSSCGFDLESPTQTGESNFEPETEDPTTPIPEIDINLNFGLSLENIEKTYRGRIEIQWTYDPNLIQDAEIILRNNNTGEEQIFPIDYLQKSLKVRDLQPGTEYGIHAKVNTLQGSHFFSNTLFHRTIPAGGTLDDTFGENGEGIRSYSFSNRTDHVQRIKLLDNDRLLLGIMSPGDSGVTSRLAVLLPDGEQDDDFSGNGELSQDDSDFNLNFLGLAVTNENEIVSTSTQSTEILIDGVLTPVPDVRLRRYSNNGNEAIDFNLAATLFERTQARQAVTLNAMAGGKIAVGYHEALEKRRFAFVQFLMDGTLDTGFGENGLRFVEFPQDAWITDTLVDKDGKILALGQESTGGFLTLAITRLLANGNLDSEFGEQGKVRVSFEQFTARLAGVALEKEGHILVAVALGNVGRISLIRFDATGNRDMTFGNDGELLTSVYASPDPTGEGLSGRGGIGLFKDGSMGVAGLSELGEVRIEKYLPEGILDIFFGNVGIQTYTPEDTATVDNLIVLPNDKVAVAGTIDDDAFVMRLNP